MNLYPARFRVEDLELLDVQPRHASFRVEALKNQEAYHHQETEFAWTFWNVYGLPVACAGITAQGWAWAFLGNDLARYMVGLTRMAQRLCMLYDAPIWAEIDAEHPEAVRWATLIGFKQVDTLIWRYPI